MIASSLSASTLIGCWPGLVGSGWLTKHCSPLGN
ncbi:Uncharacterised protein [Vibrio cholerae]|nr:Uncharacterised protein [Vibrio cholerae]CSI52451.1 Uncharacterised protein [Vibrio cholerae]CSI54209.1 Uncharacterised protein [Vibrio cholerae]